MINVHAYFLCYNEEYILPHLLHYYSSFCSKITILDNYSTDRSLEIIKAYPNTEIIQYESSNQIRDDYYISLKNNMWKDSRGNCDYVIVADADEFLYHTDIKGLLSLLKQNKYTVAKPTGYWMIGDEDLVLKEGDNLLTSVTEGIRGEPNDKMILFDPNEIDEINYGWCCHHANPVGNVKLYTDSDLKLLHYKYLGLADFIPKQLKRGERLSDFNKQNGLGLYYMYDENTHKDEYKTFIQKRLPVLNNITK